MSSSIKLKNANGKTVSVTNSNANQTDKEVIYLNTVDELANASGSINAVAIVSDLFRGGTFEWSATGTANGGTVFAGATGYWNRQYSGAVNVKWFGAKGDGIADDTIAIQSTINYVLSIVADNNLHNNEQNSASSVICGQGLQYLISDSLLLPSNVGNYTIENISIKVKSTFPLHNYVFSKNTTSGTSDFVRFSNLNIDCNNIANGIILNTVIRFTFCNINILNVKSYGLYLTTAGFECMFSNIFIKNTTTQGQSGIFITGGFTDNHFTDCIIENFFNGVESFAQANRFTRLHMYNINSSGYGIRQSQVSSGNSYINCYFDGCRAYIDNPKNIIFTNNSFISTLDNQSKLVLNAYTSGHNVSNVLITNNSFIVPVGTDCIIASGLFNQDNVVDVLIQNNTCSPASKCRATKLDLSTSLVDIQATVINFSSYYLFGRIEHLSLSLYDTRNNKVVPFVAAYGNTPSGTSSFSIKAATTTYSTTTPYPITGVTDTAAINGILYYSVSTTKISNI